MEEGQKECNIHDTTRRRKRKKRETRKKERVKEMTKEAEGREG